MKIILKYRVREISTWHHNTNHKMSIQSRNERALSLLLRVITRITTNAYNSAKLTFYRLCPFNRFQLRFDLLASCFRFVPPLRASASCPRLASCLRFVPSTRFVPSLRAIDSLRATPYPTLHHVFRFEPFQSQS